MDNNSRETPDSVNLLGIEIDNHLKSQWHVSTIC